MGLIEGTEHIEKASRETATLSPKANQVLSQKGKQATGSPGSFGKQSKKLDSKSSNSKVVFQNKRGSVTKFADDVAEASNGKRAQIQIDEKQDDDTRDLGSVSGDVNK
jgi:hypothetical protein